MIEIIRLCYSAEKNDFRIDNSIPKKYVPQGWEIIAQQMDKRDAEFFIRHMNNKYVKGRKKGRYPTIEIIKIELDLFIKLKNYKRKLV